MFINIHLRNITIPSRKHHRSITTLTETPKHHRHRAETSPTQNQGITHISTKHHNAVTTHHRDTPETSPTHHLKITKTSLAHAENILTHHQAKESLKHLRDITESSMKRKQNITEISPRHHQSITKTSLKHN